MHSRILMSSLIATFGVTVVFFPKAASTIEWYDGQEILVECPSWNWDASQIPGVVYELCFDDIDQCAVVDMGDSACVPGLGVHDVWVTAIDYQGADPVYYDGDVASIRRTRNSDFDGSGAVELRDLFALLGKLGMTGEYSEDMNEDGVVTLGDLMILLDALGKCIDEAGQLYEAC